MSRAVRGFETLAVSAEHLLEVGGDDACLKQARVEAWSLQEDEVFLFPVDVLMLSLAPSRVKSHVRSWSRVPVLSRGDFNFCLSSTKIL